MAQSDKQQLPDLREYLKGYYRDTPSLQPLTAGAGTIRSRAPQPGYVWKVDLVTVAGSGIAGGRVSLYTTSAAPDNFVGTRLAAAAEPGVVFEPSGDPWWVRPGEPIVAVVSGASADDVSMAVWYRLFELRTAPRIVINPQGDFPGYADQHDGDASADAPDESDLRDRDPLVVGEGRPRADDGARTGNAVGGLVTRLPADPGAPLGSDPNTF